MCCEHGAGMAMGITQTLLGKIQDKKIQAQILPVLTGINITKPSTWRDFV